MDWDLRDLSSVVEFRGGGTPSTEIPEYWDGNIPWVSPKDMKSDEIGTSIDKITIVAVENSAASIIPAGSVLVVVRSGILARTIPIALTTQDLAVNQDVKALCPIKSVNHRFLYYFLRSVESELLKLVTRGATVHRLSTGCLRALQIPVPSLPEQKRIVAIPDEALEEISAATAKAKKNLANARELFTTYRDSVFVQMGEGWATCPLAHNLHLITYGFTNPMPSTAVGPYMITAKNVVRGKIDYASARHTSLDAFKNLLTDKSRPSVGDVLLTKDGTLGRVAVVDKPDICVNQSVAVLRPSSRMDSNFLRHLLESAYYQDRMIADAGGTTIKHIYITRVDKMDVSYPTSLPEQRRIVRKLDLFATETERLNAIYQRKLDNLAELRQAILQKAFAGEITAQPNKKAVLEAAA